MSLVMAAALVLATVMALIVPGVARAATTSTVTGTFAVNSGTFAVDNVEVYIAGGASTTDPSPNADYHVKVCVTDLNGLDNVTQVNVILFWESDGAYTAGDQAGSDNVQGHATFKWTPAGDFVLVGPSSTWTCDNSSSIEPSSFAVTQDYFEFHVHIGDVATYAPSGSTPRWFAYASAANGTATTTDIASGALTMQWYGAISAGTTVSWSGALPGTGYTKADNDVSVNYISNGDYKKNAEASSPWSTVANLTDSDTLVANQFALKTDDQNTTESSAHRLISTGYRQIGAGTQTLEAGHDDTSGFWLKIGSPFTAGTYTGTITFQISN